MYAVILGAGVVLTALDVFITEERLRLTFWYFRVYFLCSSRLALRLGYSSLHTKESWRCVMEDGSLLVPVYGFGSMEKAVQYREQTQDQRCSQMEKNIYYNQQHSKYYVPIPECGGLPAIGLMEVSRVLTGERRFTLRRRQDPKPPEAYTAIMLMFGLRRFDYVCRDSDAPSWVRRISSGERDCFAAWVRNDGQFLHRTTLCSIQGEEFRVHIARSARGLVYARRLVLGERGHVEGQASRTVGLSLTIFDKHPDKDDVLSLQTFALDDHDWPAADPSIKLTVHQDAVWRGLAHRVLAGFKQECSAWPEDAEVQRRLVICQQARAREDARLPAQAGFYELIHQVGWQDALSLVEEPWQMEMVCRVYGERRKHYDINGARLPAEVIKALIDKAGFAEERRSELLDFLQYAALILPPAPMPP